MNSLNKYINAWKNIKNVFSWIEEKASKIIQKVKNKFANKVAYILDLTENNTTTQPETKEEINKLPSYKNIVWYTNNKGVDFAVFINPEDKTIEHIFTVTKDKNKQTPCRFQREIIEQKWEDKENLRKNFTRIRKNGRQKEIVEYALQHKNNPTPEYIPGKNKKITKNSVESKNPDFSWKYSYVNWQWRRFKFLAKNWKITHIIADDDWVVNASQKWAIQKFINNKTTGKFKELTPSVKNTFTTKKIQPTPVDNSFEPSITEQQENIIDQWTLQNSIKRIQKKAEQTTQREISINLDYQKLEPEIAILFKYDPNKKPNREEKRAATILLEQLSKKIPKRKNDNYKRAQDDTMKILFDAIQEYTERVWLESKRTESKRSALFSAFISAKYAFMNSMNSFKPQEHDEKWFVYNA